MQQRTQVLNYEMKNNINKNIFITNFGQKNKINVLWQSSSMCKFVCLPFGKILQRCSANFAQLHTRPCIFCGAKNMVLILITSFRFLLCALHSEFLYYDAAQMPVEPRVLR